MRRRSTKRFLVEGVFDEVKRLNEEGFVIKDVVEKVIRDHKLDIKYGTFIYHYYRIKNAREATAVESTVEERSQTDQVQTPPEKQPIRFDSNTEVRRKVEAIFQSNRGEKDT